MQISNDTKLSDSIYIGGWNNIQGDLHDLFHFYT